MLVSLRILLVIIAAPAIIIALVFSSCVEDQPVQQKQWALTALDITHAKEILNSNNSRKLGLKEKTLSKFISTKSF